MWVKKHTATFFSFHTVLNTLPRLLGLIDKHPSHARLCTFPPLNCKNHILTKFSSTDSLLCSPTLAHFLITRQTATPQECQRKAGCLAAQTGSLIPGIGLVLTAPGGWKTWRASWRRRCSFWRKRGKPWGWKQRNTIRKLNGASINYTTESQGWRKVRHG